MLSPLSFLYLAASFALLTYILCEINKSDTIAVIRAEEEELDEIGDASFCSESWSISLWSSIYQLQSAIAVILPSGLSYAGKKTLFKSCMISVGVVVC